MIATVSTTRTASSLTVATTVKLDIRATVKYVVPTEDWMLGFFFWPQTKVLENISESL